MYQLKHRGDTGLMCERPPFVMKIEGAFDMMKFTETKDWTFLECFFFFCGGQSIVKIVEFEIRFQRHYLRS